MKKSEGEADGPPHADRASWAMGSPDHECDCPGPPPQLHLPPPPRPHFLLDSECSENSTSPFNTCEAVPVIDAEYRFSPAVPSLVIILTVAVAVVVFLLIGTFLVLLKKRKMQHLFPRKSSPQNRCDAASVNGVIYEDLTNVRPRMLSPGQTTLPSIEMLDVGSYPDTHAPALICSTSPVPDSFDSRELYNPVYEELSNGSGDGGESNSDGMPRGAGSDDEFAEDELSFGAETDIRRREDVRSMTRDADSSDSDDKSKFLDNSTWSPSGVPPDRPRTCRGSYFGKRQERRKDRRNKTRSPLPVPPVGRNDFHEGFLLKRILQIYPDVTGMGLQYARGPHRPENPPGGCKTPDAVPRAHLQPEIFSTFGHVQGFPKKQSHDSSLGSDSGYSNNTSGGKSSSRTRKEYGQGRRSENSVLS